MKNKYPRNVSTRGCEPCLGSVSPSNVEGYWYGRYVNGRMVATRVDVGVWALEDGSYVAIPAMLRVRMWVRLIKKLRQMGLLRYAMAAVLRGRIKRT